jgi:hypothetical protein
MNSSTRPALVILGGCCFTSRVVAECVARGVVPRRVVVDARTLDVDPRGSGSEPTYDYYHRGWREALRQLCDSCGVEHVVSDRPFACLEGELSILLVAGLGRKVPDRVLERFGPYALNAHPSLLPAYAGPQPEAQVILHEEPISGVTLHTMTSRFDEGPIRYQRAFEVPPTANVDDLEQIESRLAAEGVVEITGLWPGALPEVRSSARPSRFGWYEPEVTLDLGRCRTMEEMRKLIRLRPEGLAFRDTLEDGRLYPSSPEMQGPGHTPECAGLIPT